MTKPTEPSDNTVFLTLIKEVKSLLSEMEELLFLLTDNKSDKKQIATKLHGLSSTIMGVASMVDLDELTNTATLLNKVLDGIIENKLTLSPQLLDVMTETLQHINTYCSSLETKENKNDKLFKNALSAFSEFGDFSTDHVDKPDSQKEESEEDFFLQLSEDEDSDDSDNFFEDLDMDIFGEGDIPPDMPSETANSGTIDSVMTDLGMAGIDPEFLESFNEESKDHLNSIGQQLNLLSPSINNRTDISDEYREMLHSIRRSVHTLKGAAAVIGIKSVASFGNEFEDFLDWLHDESDNLSPEIVTAMLDGTDILEKLSVNPTIEIDNEIDEIKNVFKAIMAASSDVALGKQQTYSVDADRKQKSEPESIDEPTDQPTDQPIDQPIDQPKVKQIKASKTLRVDMQKVDQMIGLIGDIIKICFA